MADEWPPRPLGAGRSSHSVPQHGGVAMTPQFTRPVTLDSETFARLVGRKDDRTLLFEVSDEFVARADGSWSDPVRFRIVREEGVRVTIELRVYP